MDIIVFWFYSMSNDCLLLQGQNCLMIWCRLKVSTFGIICITCLTLFHMARRQYG